MNILSAFNTPLGVFVGFITVVGILEGGRRFFLFLSRSQGRKPMATYADHWGSTRA